MNEANMYLSWNESETWRYRKENVGKEEYVSVTSTWSGCTSYFSSSTPFPSGRHTLPSQGICHWDTLQTPYHTSHTASHNLQINMRSNVTQSHKSALAVLKPSVMEQAGTLVCFFSVFCHHFACWFYMNSFQNSLSLSGYIVRKHHVPDKSFQEHVHSHV